MFVCVCVCVCACVCMCVCVFVCVRACVFVFLVGSQSHCTGPVNCHEAISLFTPFEMSSSSADARIRRDTRI